MKISVIGAGNVGQQLIRRFYECGHEIVEIATRTQTYAYPMAAEVEARVCVDLSKLSLEADIYLLCVNDDNIPSVAAQVAYLNQAGKIVAHTSGSTPQTSLASHFEQYGVFYPLQTFSKGRAVDFMQLTFCVDGSTPEVVKRLTALARSIGDERNLYHVNDSERGKLHIGAVFVNNFVNHLYRLAADYCAKENVPFDALKSLLLETAAKVQDLAPQQCQTGPAKRGDESTIQRHLKMLESFPQQLAVYELLTKSIFVSEHLTGTKK